MPGKKPAQSVQPKCKGKKCRACHREAKVRGLCKSCYMALRRAVQRKETTFEQAEKKGVILPPERGGRPGKAWARLKELVK